MTTTTRNGAVLTAHEATIQTATAIRSLWLERQRREAKQATAIQ